MDDNVVQKRGDEKPGVVESLRESHVISLGGGDTQTLLIVRDRSETKNSS